MISPAAWKSHLANPGYHRTLPDGTPLTWTASKADLFEDIAGVYQPVTAHDAELFLYIATRTADEMIALWRPAPPTVDGAPALRPRHRFQEQLENALRWRDTHIPVAARPAVLAIVTAIIEHEYADALELDSDALDDLPEDPEKKSPTATPTGSSPPSTPSAPALPDGPTSFTISPSTPSSPPTGPGSTPTETPSSPPPAATSATP